MDAMGRILQFKVPKLEATGIVKSFGRIEVLKGISLTAHEGEVISILGSSGSGKSTFLRCLNFLETPTGGSVSVDGETVIVQSRAGARVTFDAAQIRRIRTKIAMVFQNFNLWSHMTALQNVTAAPIHVLRKTPSEAEEIGSALLQSVGMWPHRNQYPAFLSGGQQQRVAIARALAMNPQIMLFDEPTSALDPELVGEVLKTLRDLALSGRNMIIVTHEIRFAKEVSDRIVFFHDGRILEEGAAAEILQKPKSAEFQKFLGQVLS